MDVLSDLLNSSRLESAVHFWQLSAPWGIEMPNHDDRAIFYIVFRGACYLQLKRPETSMPLADGDLVMLPQGPSHILRDRPGSPVIPWAELMKKPTDAMCPAGQETSGGDTALVSGYFRFELITANHNLFSVLPSLIHVRAKDGQTVVGLDETLKFVATESVSDSPGSQIVVARLMDMLFVQIIRALITGVIMHECQEKVNICLALADPQVGKALALVHEHPNHLWTVATLASQVGMSRTAFAV
jgi:hypothetical protein